MKPQSIRLLDVFVFGPFMLYASYKAPLSRNERLFLALLGAGTIFYNARNYLIVQKEGIE